VYWYVMRNLWFYILICQNPVFRRMISIYYSFIHIYIILKVVKWILLVNREQNPYIFDSRFPWTGSIYLKIDMWFLFVSQSRSKHFLNRRIPLHKSPEHIGLNTGRFPPVSLISGWRRSSVCFSRACVMQKYSKLVLFCQIIVIIILILEFFDTVDI
jgi:hypothetical protein